MPLPITKIIPSILAALGNSEFQNEFGFSACRRAVFILIDGLGSAAFRSLADAAPYLSSLPNQQIARSVLPSTTTSATSSLTTGMHPSEHGIVGTLFLVAPGVVLNALHWSRFPGGHRGDLLSEFPPESFQPRPTLFERVPSLTKQLIAPSRFVGSGLSRAANRGIPIVPAYTTGDLVAETKLALRSGVKFVYSYLPELDAVGHMKGCLSPSYREHLTALDHAVKAIADELPSETLMVLTSDHGFIDVPEGGIFDLHTLPDLSRAVEWILGEGRFCYIHAMPGARDEVAATWQDFFGDKMSVMISDEARDQQLLGPNLTPEIALRMGDVVAIAREPVAVVDSSKFPRESKFIGFHGATTDEELLVPVISESR